MKITLVPVAVMPDYLQCSDVVKKGAASAPVAQCLRWQTCIQQTWVQFSLVPVWVIGVGRKGIWPKLLPCAGKIPNLVPRYLCRQVWALEQGSQRH